MTNVIAYRKKHISPFRKIAIGTWQNAYDPSIHGHMTLRADRMLAYIEAFRQQTGQKLTVTQVVAKATALALKACPEANAFLRFNTLYIRKNIDVSVLVMMDDGHGNIDLSSAKIEKADQKPLTDIVEEMESKVRTIRQRKDPALEHARSTMRWIPGWCMNAFLKAISFVSYTLNIDLSFLKMPKDAFGGAIVTSRGPLGLDCGYPPLVPYSKVGIYVAPGEVYWGAVVEEGRVVPRQLITVNATMDHRIVDGAHCAVLAKTLRSVIENPFEHLDVCVLQKRA
jgi:pyruvate/2-oxoglutarate dehydrogenase complex dihydrolipoamide acyltransferase (E2) component